MSEDISKEPRRPLPLEPTGKRSDYLDKDCDEGPRFPRTITVAGALLIVFGCLALLDVLLLLAMDFRIVGGGDDMLDWGAKGIWEAIFPGLIGAAFLFVGVLSVRGALGGALGTGIISIAFGLLSLAFGFMLFVLVHSFVPPDRNTFPFVESGVAAVGGGLLLLAGVLVLTGRDDYKLWKRWQKDQSDRAAAERL